MAKQFTLGKEERLKSRKAIEQLFKEGKSFSVAPYRIFYLLSGERKVESGERELKVGVGASTKNFKKAVDRNRVKRLTREAYRLQKKELQEKLKETNACMNLFLIYTAKELPDYKLVSAKLGVILKKLCKLIHENNTPHS